VVLDPLEAQAYKALAKIGVYSYRWADAERGYRRALELSPNDANVHQEFGIFFLVPMGRLQEGIRELRRALELDPLSADIASHLAEAFLMNSRYAEAIAQAKRAVDLDPAFGRAHADLSSAYLQTGRYAEAFAELEERGRILGSPADSLGFAYAFTGRREEALAIIHQDEANNNIKPTKTAMIYAALGDKDRAFHWLEKAYEEKSATLIYLARFPAWSNLRGDPRFNSLLKKLGLPQ
jgi:tetratricopeptide (TPR) repeat protein